MNCPACSSNNINHGSLIETCQACGAIFSEDILLHQVAKFVDLYNWHSGDSSPEDERYFDFIYTKPSGESERNHGWFNIHSKAVTQSG